MNWELQTIDICTGANLVEVVEMYAFFGNACSHTTIRILLWILNNMPIQLQKIWLINLFLKSIFTIFFLFWVTEGIFTIWWFVFCDI